MGEATGNRQGGCEQGSRDDRNALVSSILLWTPGAVLTSKRVGFLPLRPPFPIVWSLYEHLVGPQARAAWHPAPARRPPTARLRRRRLLRLLPSRQPAVAGRRAE